MGSSSNRFIASKILGRYTWGRITIICLLTPSTMETLNWRLLALVIAMSFVLASAEPVPEPESEPVSGSGEEQAGNAATWMNGNIFAMFLNGALHAIKVMCILPSRYDLLQLIS